MFDVCAFTCGLAIWELKELLAGGKALYALCVHVQSQGYLCTLVCSVACMGTAKVQPCGEVQAHLAGYEVSYANHLC